MSFPITVSPGTQAMNLFYALTNHRDELFKAAVSNAVSTGPQRLELFLENLRDLELIDDLLSQLMESLNDQAQLPRPFQHPADIRQEWARVLGLPTETEGRQAA